MMSNLHSIIPGAENWAHFVRNKSEQFEARFAMVEVQESPSLFFAGMAGSRMPIAVAHGEGFAEFSSESAVNAVVTDKLVTMRYVDNAGKPTEMYPFNPNGSPQGITGSRACFPYGAKFLASRYLGRGWRVDSHV
jgi:phosphoribosylformylglycinamidine synthase